MISVVIPAHDEAAVIDRCLDALLGEADAGEIEVVVACNGCTDDTAERARRHGPAVTVVEVASSGKIGALNAGDTAATGFPRIYLDADVVLTTAAARATAGALSDPRTLAAAPRPVVIDDGCPPLIVAHHRAWSALPVLQHGYVGTGVYGLSAAGHARAMPLPDVIADDEYVRRSFTPGERATAEATFAFYPPRTVRAYLRRALRGHAGNAQLEASDLPLAPQDGPLRDGTPAPASGLRGLLPLLRQRSMWFPVASFVTLTALVRARLALARGTVTGWHRDETTRQHAGGALQ